MDYNELLNWVTDIGCCLQESGAEVYRVEESVNRLLSAYGVNNGEVFAIPNTLIVSFTTPNGETKTKLRRIAAHGTDITLLEKYNDLCRRLCTNPIPIPEARHAMDDIRTTAKSYPFGMLLFGYFICTSAFCLFFKGSWLDALASGICGIISGLCLTSLTRLKSNLFIRTLLAAFISAFLAILFVAAGFGAHTDYITIGALMALVPGIIFTNFIRDIMAGDMVAGLLKLTEALVIGGAIAIGTGAALGIYKLLGGLYQ